MNRVTEAYLKACTDPDSPLRTTGLRLAFEPNFAKAWGARQLSRPLFVPERHVQQAAADLHALFELMFTLPDRLYDGDVARLCADLGMSERSAALACAAHAAGRTPLYARPDLYYDGTALRVMELNAGSELGGVDADAINAAYLDQPEFCDFADEHHLGFVETANEVAAYLRRLARPVTGGERDPVVGLIDISGTMDVWIDFYRAFVAHMEPRGIDVRICHIRDLGVQDGKLTVDGTPIDVAMRYFTLEEICAEPEAEQWLAPVLKAHADNRTMFFASLDYAIHANKGMLALVSEMREDGALSDAEAAMVDRIVPWTRRVTPKVWDHCRANQARLVIKPTVGSGGEGVTAGWEVTAAEWETAFHNALSTPHIAQERVGSAPQEAPEGDAPAASVNWTPVFGMFVFDHGYGGTFIRALRAAEGGVVNVNTGASFTTIFTFPGE